MLKHSVWISVRISFSSESQQYAVLLHNVDTPKGFKEPNLLEKHTGTPLNKYTKPSKILACKLKVYK